MINTTTPRLARLLSVKVSKNYCRTICTTREQRNFYESSRKGGYPKKSDYHEDPKSPMEKMRQGYKYLLEEMKMFKDDVKEKLQMDPCFVYRPGEVDVKWRFTGDPEMLNNWVVTSDSDFGEGNSVAKLEMSRTGKAVFSGSLDSRVTRDGRIKRTGYCNLQSVCPRKSFQRSTYLDWGPYTHLSMNVRGDGRNYLLTLSAPGDFDIFWNDSYQYVLYTRGGPYWQHVRIPFSKFLLTSKGRVQDTQQPVPTNRIKTLGITVGDKICGPFKLEIDYIGVEFDPIMDEDHAYEMYQPPHKFVV